MPFFLSQNAINFQEALCFSYPHSSEIRYISQLNSEKLRIKIFYIILIFDNCRFYGNLYIVNKILRVFDKSLHLLDSVILAYSVNSKDILVVELSIAFARILSILKLLSLLQLLKFSPLIITQWNELWSI